MFFQPSCSHHAALVLHNIRIEDKIQESAEELSEVNTLLEHEVDERIALERELLVTKAALAQAKTELVKK